MKSRIWQFSVLALSALVVGGSVARAQPAAPALPVAQFVDETTLVVADINIGAVDLDASRAWAVSLFKQGGMPEPKLGDFDKESAGAIGMFKKWQADFVKAGGSHLYVIAGINQDAPVTLVFPVGAGGNAEALKQTLSKDGGLPQDMVRGTTTEVIGNMLVMGPASAVKNAKEIAANPQRTPRPDLAAAFAAAGDAPHRLAFAPSEQAKGGMIIQQPKLPQELGGGATAPVVNAFKYAYLTLTTPTATSPKVTAQIVVQARDATGAQKLKEIADTGMKLLRQSTARSGSLIPPELIDKIAPQVAGDKLTVEVNQAKLEAASKAFVIAIQKSQEQAFQIKSMSNMRQILLANMMYANENKGNLPAKLPDDVTKYLSAGPGGDAQKMIFTNPINGRYPGYIYVKPAEKLELVKNPTETVMLYEAYDQWPQNGLGVGFADGHCELIKDEAAFKKMLNNK